MNKWLPKSSMITLIVSFVILAVVYLLLASATTPTATSTNLLLPTPKQTAHTIIFAPSSWNKIRVKRGDSLARVFHRLGIHYQDLVIILKNRDAKKYLNNLRPGKVFYVRIQDKHLLALKFPLNDAKTLYVYLTKNKTHISFKQKPETRSLAFKSFAVKRPLLHSALEAGLTHKMYDQLITIFKAQVNLKKLTKTDHLNILYEEFYINGEKFRPGNIVAAELLRKNKQYYAFRFTYPHDHTGYYNKSGHNVERSYLRAPVNYKRISGHFNYHRFDPYLHKFWPHLGIDYAVNYGTPVHSIADGKVVFRGHLGGYGNAIIVKYSAKYRALYGHLSHFARHLKPGDLVSKGQIIGYTGSTGWSTGPHLHFEVYVYGKPKNPLDIKFPRGHVIPKNYTAKFNARADQLLSTLQLYEHKS